MSDVSRQHVSDQSIGTVRLHRAHTIVAGLPSKSWRGWHWGQTAEGGPTSFPCPPRVGRNTPVRTTMLQCRGCSRRRLMSATLSRTRLPRTSTTTWPSADSSTIGYQAPRRRTSATLSVHRAQPNVAMQRFSHDITFRYISLRSEEHTSELQSQSNLVCRLLLEKKKRPEEAPGPPRAPDNRRGPRA